jgi:hypothetical protein
VCVFFSRGAGGLERVCTTNTARLLVDDLRVRGKRGNRYDGDEKVGMFGHV